MFSNPVPLSTYLTLFGVYDLPSEVVYFIGVSRLLLLLLLLLLMLLQVRNLV
jgi:hypothetical protein